ncbi:cytochrome P450 [Lentzea aerocolonigenes]|uniref:cytochrome P450 n=1 Tax=Lentzea aerocolonigenes TaxID=68170 RepID=UPI0004C3908B|nr:cytochrome P450 [Lentzea aerocolonigenes]MCP2241552.1 Cytochrome P450 [Lentzea aerocolonigenes]
MTTHPEPVAYPFSEPDRLVVHPRYGELRDQGELERVQLPFGKPTWLATRHEDVKIVLGDPRFSREKALGEDEPRILSFTHRPDSILTMDPPGHTRLRKAVARAFTKRRIETIRPRTQQIVDELLDEMVAAGDTADLVRQFALAVPMMVICELLGGPYEDRHKFHHWSEILASTRSSKHTKEDIAQADKELRDYLAELVDTKRANPGDDLLSVLVETEQTDDPLTPEEIVGLAWSVLLAGFEITTNMLVNSVYLLLTNPDQREQLVQEAGLLEKAVEELLRFVPLTVGSFFPRMALEDVELSGTLVRKGETVLPSTLAANRDEAVFPNADQLDFHRDSNAHLTFSYGIHHCLGAPLARMELQVAIGTLLRRLPGLRLVAEDELPWRSGSILRGPSSLLVTW